MRAVLSAINLPHVDKYKTHGLKRGRTRDTMKKERNLKEILVAADWRWVGTVAHQSFAVLGLLCLSSLQFVSNIWILFKWKMVR